MRRRTALLLSGAITAFALMVVIGVVYGAGRINVAAAAAPAAAQVSAAGQAGNSANPADVAALQQQVKSLQDELQKAYADLQTAYNQIASLQGQAAGGGTGRFRGEGRQRQFQGQSPLGQNAPFFGDGD